MSPGIPAVTAKEVVSVAANLGFRLDRQKGSHAVFVRGRDKLRVVIPMHAGKTLKPKTLAGIIRDLGLTVEEFVELL
ncbi:MAG: type II toxin-antitoxin system HicA family toxin [Armatimonadetes bacterium]|nr:type II toxin-antitoxin system HicA family toxin [Armatimonadota bacterium]